MIPAAISVLIMVSRRGLGGVPGSSLRASAARPVEPLLASNTASRNVSV